MLVRSVSLLLRLRNGIRHVLNNQVAPHPFLACLHSLSSYSLLPPFYASCPVILLILPSMLIPGTYVPWPSEDIMRRGRLAQLAVEGLIDPPPAITAPPSTSNATQETEPEEQKAPRRNPGRRATSVEARRRKMSAGGEPKPITAAQQQQQLQKKEEMDFELDLFNPDEDN